MQQRYRSIAQLWAIAVLLWTSAGTALANPSPPQVTAQPAADAPLLILISIDGYRADYFDRGHSPALASLAAEGVHAKGLRPVYPSITFPNHYTLVTGLYPDKHGVVNNSMHDPALGNFTPGNPAANTDGRWWDEAEPIWVTAENKGRRTASVFWPGTQAEIRSVRPALWQLFDGTVPPNTRVNQVLRWIDLPADQRPSFVSLYFDQVDAAGHNYGPDSSQVNDTLAKVDAALGQLVAGLKQRNRLDTTNLVIVSDHGMSATSPDRVVLLDPIVNLEHVEIISSVVNLGLNPKPGFKSEVEKALLKPHPHLQCWKKGNMPKKFHYGKNPRIPAIQCLTDDGWIVSTKAAEAERSKPLLGEHGYDPDDPNMYALFVARGPSFKQGLTVPLLDNINVYSLLAKLIGIPPRPNAGNPAATAAMLNP